MNLTAAEIEALKLLVFNKGYVSRFVEWSTYSSLMDKRLIRMGTVAMKMNLTAAGKRLAKEI